MRVGLEGRQGLGRAFEVLLAAGAGLIMAAPATAQDVAARVGDWDYGSDGQMAAASTSNADGAMFGLVCSRNCIGYINDDHPCEEGAAYEAVMTSPGRADRLRLECRHTGAGYALLFTPNEAFIDTLRNGPEVAVTVRRSGHADRDYRFSLDGAHAAVYITLATAIAISGERPGAENPGF